MPAFASLAMFLLSGRWLGTTVVSSDLPPKCEWANSSTLANRRWRFHNDILPLPSRSLSRVSLPCSLLPVLALLPSTLPPASVCSSSLIFLVYGSLILNHCCACAACLVNFRWWHLPGTLLGTRISLWTLSNEDAARPQWCKSANFLALNTFYGSLMSSLPNFTLFSLSFSCLYPLLFPLLCSFQLPYLHFLICRYLNFNRE